jgi:hypothetical protein
LPFMDVNNVSFFLLTFTNSLIVSNNRAT